MEGLTSGLVDVGFAIVINIVFAVALADIFQKHFANNILAIWVIIVKRNQL